VPACSVVSFSTTEEILNRYMGEGGERGIDRAQMIGPNCSMTHSPGKIEYYCRYFFMSFRKQIGEYKFGKNCFYTLRSTMSHRPSTNSSSLKITAAYYTTSQPLDMGRTNMTLIIYCTSLKLSMEPLQRGIQWRLTIHRLYWYRGVTVLLAGWVR
jgi:hypothetical protein